MSEIEALGYAGFRVSDIAQWMRFAEDIAGLRAVQRPDGALDLRCDDQAWRLRVCPGDDDDIAFLGWQVADGNALERLARRLHDAGVQAEEGGQADLADRCVLGLLRFDDPEGMRHEAFFGPLQKTNEPFVSPLGVSFKTRDQGLGHVVLKSKDNETQKRFFTEVLGFRVSDYIRTEVVPGRPLEIVFMRCNARHHSLAIAPAPVRKRIIHLMLETRNLDDVGRALDRCIERGRHLSFTLGRHSNDNMLSFYVMTPSGFDLEFGWGGLSVEEATWRVKSHDANSAWGHVFQPPPKREK